MATNGIEQKQSKKQSISIENPQPPCRESAVAATVGPVSPPASLLPAGISVTSSMNSTPLFKDHTVNAIDYLDLKKGYTREETIAAILDDPLNPAFVDVLSMSVKQLQNLKGHSAGMVLMHDNDLAVKQDHESKTQREIETAIKLADEAWAVYEEAHIDAREKSENLSVLKNTALVLDSEIKAIWLGLPASEWSGRFAQCPTERPCGGPALHCGSEEPYLSGVWGTETGHGVEQSGFMFTCTVDSALHVKTFLQLYETDCIQIASKKQCQ